MTITMQLCLPTNDIVFHAFSANQQDPSLCASQRERHLDFGWMATTMLLGRRLLQATTQDATQDDELLHALKVHDRFFCDTMENIPAAFYFPTDAEANWKKSAPKKYHKVRLSEPFLALITA